MNDALHRFRFVRPDERVVVEIPVRDAVGTLVQVLAPK